VEPLTENDTRDWTEPGIYSVAPGVYRIPLPLPHDALRAVNIYAITDGSKLVLIDSGWALDAAREGLATALKGIGAGLGDVSQFLVTHVHRDHYTQAVVLRREFGGKIALGQLEEPSLKTAELSFRRIAYGASPISPNVLHRAEDRFGRIFAQTYGQAESPMVITCLRPEDHDRLGSCGRPFTCVEAAVVDDGDQLLPPGATGEIVCRGPQTMAYYWNRPEATAEVFRNGWLHTGDIGRMDQDGYFYILDRKNDMLISGGFNVYPREIEDVLLEYEGVVEAAVVGLPDEKWGDCVHAVIAGRAGIDPAQVLAYAAGKLASYKRPKSIEVWQELPKSGANKILRRLIRDQVIARGRVDRPAPGGP